jgi:hypothetical protein
MPDTLYGYRRGPRNPVQARLDSTTSTVNVNDMLTLATAGYYKQAAAGDVVHGVAMQYSTAPSADGDKVVLMDVSTESVYAYPPDSGTVTAALIGVTMDVGGAQSIDIDASADDCILVRDVDTANNLVYVQIRPAFAGVV